MNYYDPFILECSTQIILIFTTAFIVSIIRIVEIQLDSRTEALTHPSHIHLLSNHLILHHLIISNKNTIFLHKFSHFLKPLILIIK